MKTRAKAQYKVSISCEGVKPHSTSWYKQIKEEMHRGHFLFGL